MKKIFALVAGDPISINTEIIAKTWKKEKIKYKFVRNLSFEYEYLRRQFK